MFSAGQVEPVNAAVCSGYTDPQRLTDENSCKRVVSSIERAITDYCSENGDATGCELSEGVPSLVRNLPSFDELPNGIRNVLYTDGYLGRFGCDTLGKAAAFYSAFTRGRAPLMDTAGRIWNRIIDIHLGSGGRLSDLESEANVGYFVDPLVGNFYRNDPLNIEPQEIFEYAYRNPEYFPLLHENGFPIPFVMDDFDPETTQDDTDRRELQRTVDNIKRELRREWRGVPRDSDAHKRELAERIFDWFIDWKAENKFESADRIEYTDYEAYRLKKGDCTELSAILYSLYTYAGLEPTFLLSTDFEPNLMMLPVLDISVANHALIGVPLTSGAMIMVDPMNELFDTNYVKAIKATPRHFVAAILGNKVSEGIDKKDESMANGANRTYLSLAPESVLPYVFGLETNMLNPMRSGTILFLMERELAGHPLARFVSARVRWIHSYLSRDEGVITQATASLSDALIELEAQDAGLAAYAHHKISMDYKTTADKIKKGRMPLIEGRDLSDIVEECEERSLYHLKRSATLNPFNLFVLGGLNDLFNREGRFDEGAELFEALAAANPSHSISRYLAGRFRFLGAVNSGNSSDLMETAIEHANRLISIEPQNPIPYLMLAYHYYYADKDEEALRFWDRAKALMTEPIRRSSIREFIKVGLALGQGEDIFSFFEDKPINSFLRLLSSEVKFESLFTANENFLVATRNTLEIINSFLERSRNLPDVDSSLIESIYAKFAHVVFVLEGREKALSWLRNAGDLSRNEAQRVFAPAISMYDTFLRSRRRWDDIFLANLSDFLSIISAQPGTLLSSPLAETYMALASRYSGVNEMNLARQAFEKARGNDEDLALRALARDRRLFDVVYGPPNPFLSRTFSYCERRICCDER